MKFHILIFLVAIGISLDLRAQNFQASSPVAVAEGYGNMHPQLEVLPNGDLGMIWTDGGLNNLYFARRTPDGLFTAPVKLNPDGTQVQDYTWSGPDLAVWENTVYVVYHDLGYETGHVFLVKSSDFGQSFGDTLRLDYLTDAYPQFPDVAVYDDTVYVTYMAHGILTMNPQYMVARSTDGGQSFEPAVDVTTWIGAEACDCCQPEIVVNEDYVIIFFRQNDMNIRDIKAVVSYDRGLTFSNSFSVDDHNWNVAACPSTGPDARFLEDGTVACVYRTMVSGEAKIFVNHYDLVSDVSLTETSIYTEGIANTGINYPQIAIDGPVSGIVWEGLGNSTDVFFNGSDAGFAGYLPGNALNLTNLNGSQSKPDLVYHQGKFHVIYSELSGSKVMYVQVSSVNGLTESSGTPIVYPNPTAGVVKVDLSDFGAYTGTLSLCDFSGREIMVIPMESGVKEVSVDLTSLEAGVYYLTFCTSDQIFIERVIKQE